MRASPILLVLLAIGCERVGDAPSDAYVFAVEPPTWPAGTAPTIDIVGEAFYTPLASRLARDGVAADSQFIATLGGLPVSGLTWVDNSRLRGVAPMLAVGSHSLELSTPGNHTSLRDAVAVTEAVSADGGPPGGDARWGDPGVGTPAGAFSDDFDDGVIGPDWQLDGAGSCCQVTESGGGVRFVVDTTGVCSCSLTSTAALDLRDDAVSIAIAPISNFEPQLSFYLAVVLAPDTWEELRFHDDEFESRVVVDGAEIFVVTSAYPPEPSFWRIRDNGGTTYFESSLDQTAWEVEASTATAFPVSAVRARFGYDTSGALPRAIGIGVSGFNP